MKEEKLSESELFVFREKRKWQIALRRYVLEKSVCYEYAPYFGLDNEMMRNWFESQFQEGVQWDDFGKKWQFDHIVAVAHFDFANKEELRLCWNFTNLRVEHLLKNKTQRLDLLAAKSYFTDLYHTTNYKPCLDLLQKIRSAEASAIIGAKAQESFILRHRDYLEEIEKYSNHEFELLNRGRTREEVKKEITFLKNLKSNANSR